MGGSRFYDQSTLADDDAEPPEPTVSGMFPFVTVAMPEARKDERGGSVERVPSPADSATTAITQEGLESTVATTFYDRRAPAMGWTRVKTLTASQFVQLRTEPNEEIEVHSPSSFSSPASTSGRRPRIDTLGRNRIMNFVCGFCVRCAFV